jgi:BNR repeat-like domain
VRRTLAAGLIVFGLGVGVARVAREPTPPRSPAAPIFAAERERAPADPWSNTQVEPDSFAWGNKIVATFQSWRIFEGGAAGLGWATSADGGTRWRSGTVPLGEYAAASDPVVAFDAAHRVWLIAGIGFRGRFHDVFVSRSTDGLKWSQPVIAADSTDEDHDKEWITCDNSTKSKFRGRCYLAYVDTTRWHLGIRTSDDGGQTWSKPQRLQPGVTGPGAVFSGPVPVTRPSGDLVVPYSFFAPINQGGRGLAQEDRVAAVVSYDGGATFSQPIRISSLEAADDLAEVRAPALPSATADAAGNLYVAWQDGRFRSSGDANDIVFSTSTNGSQWTEPVRIPLSFTPTYFLPAIAVDPTTSGKKARVAVAYYAMRMKSGCKVYVPGCYQQIDAWLVQSQNGGRTWGAPRKLNGESMQVGWLADTSLGAMLGDYISVSHIKGKAVPVVALAGPPSPLGYTESIFSCRLREPPPRTPMAISSQCRRPSP